MTKVWRANAPVERTLRPSRSSIGEPRSRSLTAAVMIIEVFQPYRPTVGPHGAPQAFLRHSEVVPRTPPHRHTSSSELCVPEGSERD